MSKKLLEILKKQEKQRIAKHMPAKDAPVLTEDERSSLERFTEAYDAAWVASRDTSRNVEDDGFHPSSLGISVGACGRRNVYLLRGTEKRGTIDARVLRVFANGHAVHDRVQKTLEAMGVAAESELEINYLEPPIKGHADGVLVWEDRKILIEIKSCGDEVFVNRLKWKKPKDEHFAQANIYAYILGLDTVWIIYENKNTQETAIFEKPTDKVAAEKIIDKWWSEWLCHQDGQLPKRPYKIGSPTCAGCDVKWKCLQDEELGVDMKPYKEKVMALREDSTRKAG
jgi:hypothetical protein